MPLFFLLLLVAFAFRLWKKRKAAGGFLALAIVWLLAISTPFLPRLLLASLERRYMPLPGDVNRLPRNILVLGSGHTVDTSLPYTAILHAAGVSRLAEAARLQQMMPGSRLVFSGYGAMEKSPMALSSLLAAAEMGLDTTGAVIFPRPWNTRTEALDYRERFGAGEVFYLVTDAAHMPRAMMHFRNAGLQPIPAPAAYLVKYSEVPKSVWFYMPSSENIRNMEVVFHEYLGLWWAKLGGD